VSYSSFYLPWFAALAVASGEPAAASSGAATVIHFQGLDLPLMQSVLAVAGVLMARPLARKKESTLPWSHFAIVTVIMLVAALAWVAQSRPGVLFTFVVAIGLGFSGYSLVETAGAEIQAFLKRIFQMATDALPSVGDKK
jgi:hypothetical protein